MIPVGHVVHQLPRRVRIKVAEKKGDVAYFDGLVAALSQQPAIEEVTANPRVGSITLRYSGPLEAIASAVADRRLFELAKPLSEPEQNLKSRGRDVASDVAAGLTGLSLFRATQGPVFGSAAENFWHAFGSRRLLGRSDIAAAFTVIGIYQLLSGNWFGSASSLFFYALVLRRYSELEQAESGNPSAAADRDAVASGRPEAASGPAEPDLGKFLDDAGKP